MSGSSIPYQLRTNKFIDRQLFIDALRRVLLGRSVERCVYVSMGGKHLADHNAVYRQLGITNLFSFDFDSNIVRRQEANKPYSGMICRKYSSSEMIRKMDDLLDSFGNVESVITWLDYTNGSERLVQIEEFSNLVERSVPGDVVRITLNAMQNVSDWKDSGFSSPAQARAHRLESQLRPYFPASISNVGDLEIGEVLASTLERLAAEIERRNNTIRLRPFLLTEYKDNARMFTATVLIEAANQDPIELKLEDWGYYSGGWSNIVKINAPELSLKERAIIDQHINKDAKEVLDTVQFFGSENLHKYRVEIESYQRLHRFFPAFQHVEFG